MASQIRFEFISKYMGCCDYRVHGDGEAYRIRERLEASSYERSIFRGSEAEWQRDAVAAIGLLHLVGGTIPQRVVDAFKVWRAAEHARDVDEICSHPERYGNISRDDPRLAPPVVVRGARYEIGKGWIVNADRSPGVSAELAHTYPMGGLDLSPR